MGGWMEALADKVHKQGEHILQHCYIYPYISSNDMHTRWHNICIYCYLCRDGCVKCSNVLCGMCSPTFGRFLLEILLNFLYLYICMYVNKKQVVYYLTTRKSHAECILLLSP